MSYQFSYKHILGGGYSVESGFVADESQFKMIQSIIRKDESYLLHSSASSMLSALISMRGTVNQLLEECKDNPSVAQKVFKMYISIDRAIARTCE